MYSKRRFLKHLGCWFTFSLFPACLHRFAYAADSNHVDPRPEFAADQIATVLESALGSTDTADDATIRIEVPLVSGSKEVVPFRITAPGAEKIVVVAHPNSHPLLMLVDNIDEPVAVVTGRARLDHSGDITCYALKNGQIGRATRRIELSGHWESFS